jgi:superfamily II DNA/RNA helicase
MIILALMKPHTHKMGYYHIEDTSLVINNDVHRDAADYIHRIERTARAALKREAITFINQYD